MFFKKLEFNSLQSFNLSIIAHQLRVYSLLNHILSLIIVIIVAANIPGVFLKSSLFSISFFFLAYWVVSIFTYLLKKSKNGTFTRIIQRFWKRALYLFWLLEIGLFMIYLFLTVISPQEVSYMLDNTQLFLNYGNDLLGFFKSLVRPLVIILFANVYILAHKYNTYRNLITAAITLLLVF